MSLRFIAGTQRFKVNVVSVPFGEVFGAIEEVSDLQVFKEGNGLLRESGREGWVCEDLIMMKEVFRPTWRFLVMVIQVAL